MPYAIRVRLYRGDTLEADTDPDTAPQAPGAEVVQDLESVQRAMVDLCRAFHGEGVRLLGFGRNAQHAYLSMMRSRAGLDRPFNYRQGYSVLVDTPQVRSATCWVAQVDIAVAR